jgi:uncharacterized peroxidase-related enzyme
MARVKLIDPEQATGRTQEVFERVKSYYQMIPGLQKGLAHLPETTDALWTLSLMTAGEDSIDEELKRVFFAVTAHEVECEYCTAAHMLALLRKDWSEQDCAAVIAGKPSSRLSDRENAAVDFARQVGRHPAGVTDAMTEAVRDAGWSDAEIVEIVAAVALIRYTSTVASALDVPLEASMEGVGVSCGVPLDSAG